jgi:hypothetical protein
LAYWFSSSPQRSDSLTQFQHHQIWI